MSVIQGLQEKPVAGLCNEEPLSPAQYSPGRDQWLAHASTALAGPPPGRPAARLAPEQARRQNLVGALTRELKQRDALWGGDARGLATACPVTTRGGHASERVPPSPRGGGTAGSGPPGVRSSRARSTSSGGGA